MGMASKRNSQGILFVRRTPSDLKTYGALPIAIQTRINRRLQPHAWGLWVGGSSPKAFRADGERGQDIGKGDRP